jgi:hypothetical protein
MRLLKKFPVHAIITRSFIPFQTIAHEVNMRPISALKLALVESPEQLRTISLAVSMEMLAGWQIDLFDAERTLRTLAEKIALDVRASGANGRYRVKHVIHSRAVIVRDKQPLVRLDLIIPANHKERLSTMLRSARKTLDNDPGTLEPEAQRLATLASQQLFNKAGTYAVVAVCDSIASNEVGFTIAPTENILLAASQT